MLVRRSKGLFAFWKENHGLHLLSPLDGRTSLRIGPSIRSLVETASDWTEEVRALEVLTNCGASLDDAQNSLTLLCNYMVLDRCDTIPSSEQNLWERWGNVAKIFHAHTRNAPYFSNRDEKLEYVKDITAEPTPSIVKRYENVPTFSLPEPIAPDTSYFRALTERRTHRHFTSSALKSDDISILLAATFGIQHYVDGEEFGQLILRTSPNAGARHETEAYVYIRNVAGLDRGIYHYNCSQHALELLRLGDFDDELAAAAYDAAMVSSAPLVVVITAVSERITYKYRDGRAYRLWLYNVGHTGQTFVLTATALGLGAFQTAAFRESALEPILGVDGSNEFATYMLGAGHVADLSRPGGLLIEPQASRSRIIARA